MRESLKVLCVGIALAAALCGAAPAKSGSAELAAFTSGRLEFTLLELDNRLRMVVSPRLREDLNVFPLRALVRTVENPDYLVIEIPSYGAARRSEWRFDHQQIERVHIAGTVDRTRVVIGMRDWRSKKYQVGFNAATGGLIIDFDVVKEWGIGEEDLQELSSETLAKLGADAAADLDGSGDAEEASPEPAPVLVAAATVAEQAPQPQKREPAARVEQRMQAAPVGSQHARLAAVGGPEVREHPAIKPRRVPIQVAALGALSGRATVADVVTPPADLFRAPEPAAPSAEAPKEEPAALPKAENPAEEAHVAAAPPEDPANSRVGRISLLSGDLLSSPDADAVPKKKLESAIIDALLQDEVKPDLDVDRLKEVLGKAQPGDEIAPVDAAEAPAAPTGQQVKRLRYTEASGSGINSFIVEVDNLADKGYSFKKKDGNIYQLVLKDAAFAEGRLAMPIPGKGYRSINPKRDGKNIVLEIEVEDDVELSPFISGGSIWINGSPS